jgi:hypothetical protein
MGPCVDWRSAASAILDTGVLPAPPARSLEPGVRYPLAFDREGDLGAISFAVLDLHPRIAKGMWCEMLIYARGRGGRWADIAEHDNTTSPRPFERPRSAENSDAPWIDWHSNAGLRQGGTYWYVTISGASGAYVAAIPAAAWTLTGYGVDGERLGVLTMDHRDADG